MRLQLLKDGLLLMLQQGYFESHLIALCSTTFACVRALITQNLRYLRLLSLPYVITQERTTVLRKLKELCFVFDIGQPRQVVVAV